MTFGPLVDVDWLRERLEDPNVRVIDFRWYLQGRNGRDEYARGHIPGAVFVDLDDVTGRQGGGRHPLPAPGQFESAMRDAGVKGDTKVVVYDDAGASVAARLWFLLGYFGHHAQAVLDGGLQAWGGPLTTVVSRVERGTFQAQPPDKDRVLHFDAVHNLRGVPLIDARAGERYRGEKEPVDPKAGHIPGALSAPFTENLDRDGRFKSPDELRAQYANLGAQSGAVFYCGSGVNATHHVLAMEVAGLPNARIYAGSWSDWSSRDAPVATGSEP
jgi:thiosulfate/3-mercaptopyruvate sulfurtransferase